MQQSHTGLEMHHLRSNMSRLRFTLSVLVENKISMTLFVFIHVPLALLKLHNAIQMHTSRTKRETDKEQNDK